MDETGKILMVVREAEARAAYEEALQRVGASYDVAHSFKDLLRMSVDNSYSGLLIDVLTLVRSSKEEKNIAYDCLNFYPSLRVKWDARSKSINLGPMEHCPAQDSEATLSYFIENRCRSFTPRSLRRFTRKDTFLSLVLSAGVSPGEGVKTFTANVSLGGAFVHTTRPLEKKETVWLRFVEMPDAEPVEATVCWRIDWGTCRSIPGVGVMFAPLPEHRADLIKQMACL